MSDRPEEGKVYALTGGPGALCLSNGNTWEESVVGNRPCTVCGEMESSNPAWYGTHRYGPRDHPFGQ